MMKKYRTIMLLFAFAALLAVRGNSQLIPVAFDSGGVTTGVRITFMPCAVARRI